MRKNTETVESTGNNKVPSLHPLHIWDGYTPIPESEVTLEDLKGINVKLSEHKLSPIWAERNTYHAYCIELHKVVKILLGKDRGDGLNKATISVVAYQIDHGSITYQGAYLSSDGSLHLFPISAERCLGEDMVMLSPEDRRFEYDTPLPSVAA